MELRGIFLFFFPSFLLGFRNFSYLGGEESFSLTSNNTFGLGIVNETRFSSFRSPFNHREARRATPLSLLPERLAISLFSETWRGDCNEKSPEQKEKKRSCFLFEETCGGRSLDLVILLLVNRFILSPNDGQRGLGMGRRRSGSLKECRKSRDVAIDQTA